MATQIQYPYALDENNNIVHIKSIEREHKSDHTYHCPCCGKPMIPRIGESNAPHFAHADNQKCGVESYVHIIAKRVLVSRFNDRSRPFSITFWTHEVCKDKDTCKFFDSQYCEDTEMKDYDLHKTYDLPAREEIRLTYVSGDQFQPDVVLTSSSIRHSPIYLEVYHKHKSCSKKLESGQHIIEIRVRDWSELEDLDTLELKQSDRVAFFNFKDIKVKPEVFRKRAEEFAKGADLTNLDYALPVCLRSREGQRAFQDWWRIVLYPSGKLFYSGVYGEEIKRHRSSALADITYNKKRIPESFSMMWLLADKIPQEHRNCFMCCHCLQNDSDVRWCELLKNGSTKKGTFKESKGSWCSFFEWYRADSKQPQHDLVEGVDYTIWINPD